MLPIITGQQIDADNATMMQCYNKTAVTVMGVLPQIKRGQYISKNTAVYALVVADSVAELQKKIISEETYQGM